MRKWWKQVRNVVKVLGLVYRPHPSLNEARKEPDGTKRVTFFQPHSIIV